ncbi:response regulator [Treponema sp. OMZ 840]|uniref:response regulator n=1 Tax=Treponema sp. OMZ 840 TaxID=244313 RepID=UPI003D93C399
MKQVLLIDTPPLFREFLKEKLTSEKISVETLGGRRDAFAKTVSMLPDLIIIDISDTFDDLTEFCEKKRSDPNAYSIPIILTGPIPPREILTKLPAYQVIKYFNKPIKFDIFFDFIGQTLRIPLSIDTTPSIMEIHLNKNIIFIELAQGLNREKLSLLKYRLDEMIEANKLISPKIVLMISNLKLSFVDAVNLELLLSNVTFDPRIQRKNIKILSTDKFIGEFVEGHEEFRGIEVAGELSQVLRTLVNANPADNITDIISEDILRSTGDTKEGTVEMRFFSESGVFNSGNGVEKNQKLQIAIVDDDPITRKILESAFASLNSTIETFDSGARFLVAANQKVYDLVILDIFMPGISGFDILVKLQTKQYPSPIIVYSSAAQKTSVIQALSLGAKAYLVKPLKPEAIIQKALEVLNARI